MSPPRRLKPSARTPHGSIRQVDNREFENQVAETLAAAGYSHIRVALKRVPGKRLSDENHSDLGDIDAVAIDPRSRLIVIGESKDFQVGRTPAELANEAAALLRNEDSALIKHLRRAAWVERNAAAVAAELGCPVQTGDWRVVPVNVTSRDLLTSRVVRCPIAFLDISRLHDWASELRTPQLKDRRRRRSRR
jgi:hypothetical protein